MDLILPAKGQAELTRQTISTFFQHHDPTTFRLHIRLEEGDADLLPFKEEWEKLGCVVHVLPKPTGFAGLINDMVPRTESEIFGLVNSDLRFFEPVIPQMLAHFADDETIGVVGCKLLFPRDSDRGRMSFKQDSIQHAGCVVHHEGVMHHIGAGMRKELFPVCRNVHGVTFALVLLRRSIYDKELPTPTGPMKGLDEACGWDGAEDGDYCLRLLANGYHAYYCAEAVAYHYESATRGTLNTPQKVNGYMRVMRRVGGRWKDTITRHLHEV